LRVTQERSFELGDDEDERFALHLHLREEAGDLRDEVEVVAEEVSFEHSGEILGDLFAFLNG
jgi:hypothetical protein